MDEVHFPLQRGVLRRRVVAFGGAPSALSILLHSTGVDVLDISFLPVVGLGSVKSAVLEEVQAENLGRKSRFWLAEWERCFDVE